MVHRVPSAFTTLDKKVHGKKRRILSQGVSDSAVRNFEPLILKHVEQLCSVVAPGSGSPVDSEGWSEGFNVATSVSYLTFDMITNMLLGRSYNLLGCDTYRWVVNAIKTSNKRVSVVVQAPIITFKRLDKKLFPRSIFARNQFLGFMKQILGTRMATKSENKDIFSGLSAARDPETGQVLNIYELGAECISLLVAGSDTTSTFISSLFFYLSKNRSAYDTLVDEICRTFSDASEVRLGPKLNSCRYLRACLDEALRMSPPVGEALFREALQGGATVDGIYIPEGISVGTSVYAMHHDESHWADPFSFSPERWLNRVNSGGEAFAPFSVGGWSCIGKGLALVQAMLTVAVVLRKFDFEILPGHEGIGGGDIHASVDGRHRPGEYQLREHVTSDCTGPVLRFRHRDSSIAAAAAP
jgi:cytochrome P450